MPTAPVFSVSPLSRIQVACSLLIFLSLAVSDGLAPAFSQTRYSLTALLHCTREDSILKAFQLMTEGPAEPSLRQIVSKPVRVVFKDMRLLNKSLKNYDALSWMSNQGDQVIFVNEKHRQAPPEALAALIAHEALHDDAENSLSEEVESWRFEATVWMALKAKNPALAQLAEGTHPLVDRENRLEKELKAGTLEAFVRSSPGYKGLPETSPGFGERKAMR
ncbi:hypothetical protein [Vampirovibrio chlorellavorus]|uniref:hypothetical protein n=1 Tax=Vampirovibrio chlorellavorus TaxID=758823 RepID=UPI0026EB66D1|nr:hypothetical protein [Vampirovibrio chlorellavorus]